MVQCKMNYLKPLLWLRFTTLSCIGHRVTTCTCSLPSLLTNICSFKYNNIIRSSRIILLSLNSKLTYIPRAWTQDNITTIKVQLLNSCSVLTSSTQAVSQQQTWAKPKFSLVSYTNAFYLSVSKEIKLHAVSFSNYTQLLCRIHEYTKI